MNNIRRNHPPAFKAQVVLALLKEEGTTNEIASKFSIHPTQATKWKTKVIDNLSHLFEDKLASDQLKEKDRMIDDLFREVGQLKMELEWLKKRLAIPITDKLKLIEPDNRQISIVSQCALLQLNRSVFYYERKPQVSPEDIYLMDKIAKIYTDFPYYGSPRITHELQRNGIVVNHKRVERLMKIMGIEAVYPKPNLSKNDKPHPVYPYLLKNLDIINPNQVWGTDITYIRVKNDWLYLVAILDWYSRYIVSWELSDTLEAGFCVNNLQTALNQALPNIHNSDQGSQFTSDEYIDTLKSKPEILISMDGRGRCMDNIFTERLWRSVKYDEVYLHDYQSPREVRQSLAKYLEDYNHKRLHQSLEYNTPAEIYFGTKTLKIKTKKEETNS